MDVTSDARRRRLEGILVCLSGKGKRAAHSPNSNNAMRVGRVRAGSDSGFPRLKPLSAPRAPARRWTLAGGTGEPYNAGVEVGRDFAMFGSKGDLAFVARTLKESVRTL